MAPSFTRSLRRALRNARRDAMRKGLVLEKFRRIDETASDIVWAADDLRGGGYAIVVYDVSTGFDVIVRTRYSHIYGGQ